MVKRKLQIGCNDLEGSFKKPRQTVRGAVKVSRKAFPLPSQSTLQNESESDPDWPTPMETRASHRVEPRPPQPPRLVDRSTQCSLCSCRKRRGEKRRRDSSSSDEEDEPLKRAKRLRKVSSAQRSISSSLDSRSSDSNSSSSDSSISTSSQSSESSSDFSPKLEPKVRRNPPRRASFTSLYTVGKLLGKGGCGAVYEGKRKADGREVAIKYINKHTSEYYLTIPGTSCRLPLEVALMQIVCQSPTCEYVLELVDWFEQPKKYILILEHPYPCMDLFEYTEQMGGKMQECLARVIMLQVVLAVRHCRDRGVLHRDIKIENLLVKTDTLRVKLIDFGCGDLLRDKPYRTFAGTEEFSPPEWVLDGKYQGRKATIWSLGVLLFNLVCGSLPFKKEAEIVAGRLRFKRGLSKSCKDLICWCLARNPLKRPVLEQILLHDWLSDVARPTT